MCVGDVKLWLSESWRVQCGRAGWRVKLMRGEIRLVGFVNRHLRRTQRTTNCSGTDPRWISLSLDSEVGVNKAEAVHAARLHELVPPESTPATNLP